MAKKKLTIKQEYAKQLKRVQKIYAEETAAGVYFPYSFVPKEVKNPTRKHIEKLKKINRWSIYRDFYAERVDPITKQKSIGRQARKERRQVQKLEKIARRTKKGKGVDEFTLIVKRANSLLERLRDELYGFVPPEYWSNGLSYVHSMVVQELIGAVEHTQAKIMNDFNFAYSVAQSLAQKWLKAMSGRNGWIYTVMYDSDEQRVQTALNNLYDMLAPAIESVAGKSFAEVIDDLSSLDFDVMGD